MIRSSDSSIARILLSRLHYAGVDSSADLESSDSFIHHEVADSSADPERGLLYPGSITRVGQQC